MTIKEWTASLTVQLEALQAETESEGAHLVCNGTADTVSLEDKARVIALIQTLTKARSAMSDLLAKITESGVAELPLDPSQAARAARHSVDLRFYQAQEAIGLRLCAGCKGWYELAKFSKQSGSRDGLSSWCNVCKNGSQQRRRSVKA